MKMSRFFDTLADFFVQFFFALKNIRFADIIDILVVAFVIYTCVEFFKKSRASQLLKGFIVLIIVFVIAQVLELVTINWLLNKLIDSLIIILAIVFQPELRRALEKMGRSQITVRGKGYVDEKENSLSCIDAVCKSCATMQEQKIGALIVFERSSLLGEISDTGTLIDAEVSSQLVSNIFFPKSPLHDGAILIRDGRVLSAGCILPLTASDGVSSNLGTRHRAAIGMSENSDAVVVVVSEETGTISIAVNGEIKRNFNSITLREELISLMLVDYSESKSTDIFRNALNGIKKIFKK